MKTLFGIMESKTEARDRARSLRDLYSSLRDAPDVLACRRSLVDQIQTFIDRSNAKTFDLNWHDGLVRLTGLEELLTERDCAQMRNNKKLWKWYKPGWLGSHGPVRYCCQLHPKEIAYLERQMAEIQHEIDNIEINVPLLKEQAEALRAVGPFPKELAERYQLTEDGQLARKP